MKRISIDEALPMIARGEKVTLYTPHSHVDSLQIAVIKDVVSKGAFFAIEGEDEPKAFPTVHEPVKDTPMSEKPKRKQVDAGRIAALHNAGWTAKAIADDVGCSLATVYYKLKEIEA